jgi:translation initiation factor IF-1
MKQKPIEALGKITEALGNSIFRAQLENGSIITTHLSGKIRLNSIQILPGDTVLIEMSVYDLTKGRIVRRLHSEKKPE